MVELTLGKNIAELRKQKGVTQEALAVAVGVTGQAVSKWEGGGSPDVELLAPIADYFGVSVDRLFGRKVRDYGDLTTELAESIVAVTDMGERVKRVMDICWTVNLAMMVSVTEPGHKTVEEISNSESNGAYSLCLNDKVASTFNFPEELRYYFIAPEPAYGWGDKFRFKDEYVRLFTLLADPDALKTLFFLYTRNNQPFTPKLLEKHLGIVSDKALKILAELRHFSLIKTSEIEFDDEVQIVYDFDPNFSFVPFLFFTEELIKRPCSFYYYYGRETPFIRQKQQ